jgi:hypothetical protein
VPDTDDWTNDDLRRLATEDEIHVSSIRRDGTARKPVTMWMVTEEGRMYVRSVNGTEGAWYRHIRATDRAQVTARGVDAEVSVEDARADADLANRLMADQGLGGRLQKSAGPVVLSRDRRHPTLGRMALPAAG